MSDPAAAKPTEPATRTRIFRLHGGRIDTPGDDPAREEEVGHISADGVIHRLLPSGAEAIGRVDTHNHVFRSTVYGERELGSALEDGTIMSVGLFAGGEAGWLNANGIVVQGGLILGEEEVGRVEGPRALAAAAALLLLFLEEQRAQDRESDRNG